MHAYIVPAGLRCGVVQRFPREPDDHGRLIAWDKDLLESVPGHSMHWLLPPDIGSFRVRELLLVCESILSTEVQKAPAIQRGCSAELHSCPK